MRAVEAIKKANEAHKKSLGWLFRDINELSTEGKRFKSVESHKITTDEMMYLRGTLGYSIDHRNSGSIHSPNWYYGISW